METEFTIPFFSNTSDDLHCFEACLRMAFAHFLPEQEFDWDALDRISGKRKGKWTWTQNALLNLRPLGFDVADIDMFNYAAFADQGAEYLKSYYGKKDAAAMVRHSDIPHERAIAQEFLASGIHHDRLPTLADIREKLAEGWLVIANVNSCKLNGLSGYVGHAVLVYAADRESLTFHDPGHPPKPARTCNIHHFLEAWDWGGKSNQNFVALRPVTHRSQAVEQ